MRRALAALAVALLPVVVYLPSLANGFVWDDRQLIVENDSLTRNGATWHAFTKDFWESEEQTGTSDYYRPIVTLSYILDRSLFGLEPAGYHRTNVLIHAGVAGLLFLLLTDFGVSLWTAALGAGLFAVHPALTESVAWISGRTDSLAVLLMLGCLLADGRRSEISWRVLSLAALAAALLAKETAVVTPLAAAILEAARRGRGATPVWPAVLRALRVRGDMLGVVAAYFVLRFLVLGVAATHGAIAGAGLGWPARLAAIPHLLGILLVPTLSRIEYGSGLPGRLLLPGAAAGVLLTVLLFAAASRRTSRISDRPVLRSFVHCGLVAFLPSIAVIALKAVVADRLIYAPAVFLLPALAGALAGWTAWRRVGIALLSTAVLVCAGVTAAKASLWRSDRVLFEKAIGVPHPSARAYLNLGIAYHDDGLLLESLDALEEALSMERLKSAYYTRGLLYTELGCHDLAVRDYEASLMMDPAYVHAANNLGALLAEMGRAAEAEEVLERALARGRGKAEELRANLELLRLARAGGETRTNVPDRACTGPDAARRLLQDARALNRRALDRLRSRQLDQAGILIEAALHRDPTLVAARLNLAQWHVLRGEGTEARRVLDEILTGDPRNEAARRLLDYLDTAP